MSKVRLVDVAERAGVSKSTVSQFLNGRFEYMSKDTAERVKNAIAELEYVPNNIARSLKTDKTSTIGVVVRDLSGAYTSQAIRAIDDYCRDHDYGMLVCNTDFDASAEAKAIRSLVQLRVDGIIIVSSGTNTDLISEISDHRTPVVHFLAERDEGNKSIILSNFKQGAFEATDYLIRLGHRRICFVTTTDFVSVKSGHERYLGYREAMSNHHIPLDDSLVQYWHRDAGFQISPRDILDTAFPPTAFFSQHLEITCSLLKELNDAQINIPEEVSLIGFDDIAMVEFFKVPITTVKQQPYEIGKTAAGLLIRKIHDPDCEHERVRVPCTLIERSSTKAIKQV